MIDSGDTAFILVSAALVLLMTPALALFYAGMVRSKNVLGTIMQSLIMISLITLEWIYIGYTMSFGPDLAGIIGGSAHLAMAGVTGAPSPDYATTVPHLVFMIYQCMFAVITPALIAGAFAERVRFLPFILFSVLWSMLVYNPVCHWIWGGGFLGAMGVLDFAGGLVVHLTCGVAALVACLFIGPRKGFGKRQFIPHNLPMTVIGTGLLWFGWFGFNGGSALAADGVAATAFVATHIAGMTGMLTWTLIEWHQAGKPTTLGACSGAIAGLATITPAAGFVSPNSAAIIGFLGGLICYTAVLAKNRFGYDDSLDVVGIHGVGGLTGTIALGLFASTAVNPGGADGLFAGNPAFLLTQLIGIGVVGGYTLIVSWLILKAVNAVSPLRMADDHEEIGMDTSEHSETAYQA